MIARVEVLLKGTDEELNAVLLNGTVILASYDHGSCPALVDDIYTHLKKALPSVKCIEITKEQDELELDFDFDEFQKALLDFHHYELDTNDVIPEDFKYNNVKFIYDEFTLFLTPEQKKSLIEKSLQVVRAYAEGVADVSH